MSLQLLAEHLQVLGALGQVLPRPRRQVLLDVLVLPELGQLHSAKDLLLLPESRQPLLQLLLKPVELLNVLLDTLKQRLTLFYQSHLFC